MKMATPKHVEKTCVCFQESFTIICLFGTMSAATTQTCLEICIWDFPVQGIQIMRLGNIFVDETLQSRMIMATPKHVERHMEPCKKILLSYVSLVI